MFPLPMGVYRPGTSKTVVELEHIEKSHCRSRRGVRSRFGPGKIRRSAWIAWKSLFGRDHGVKGLDRYAAAKAALDAMVRVQNLVFKRSRLGSQTPQSALDVSDPYTPLGRGSAPRSRPHRGSTRKPGWGATAVTCATRWPAR